MQYVCIFIGEIFFKYLYTNNFDKYQLQKKEKINSLFFYSLINGIFS